MVSTSQKLKLGAFLLASAGIALVLLVTLFGLRIGDAPAQYYVLAQDVGGLEVGSTVHMRGVRVGRVSTLEFAGDDDASVRVDLNVDEDVRIDRDAKAYFELAGVSGLKTVNIRGGNGTGAAFPPGSRIPQGETVLDSLADESERIVKRTLALLDTSERLAGNLNQLTLELRQAGVGETLQRTEALVDSLLATARKADRMLTKLDAPLNRTLGAASGTVEGVERLTRQSDTLVVNLNAAALDLRRMIRSNDDELRTTLKNFAQASRDLEALSRQLRRRPNLLLFSKAPPERELP